MRDDQGFWDARRYLVGVGPDFFVDADNGGIGIDADLEARRDHEVVVINKGVDMIHVGDAFDDGFERLGGQFDRVGGMDARRLDHDVDHGDADLRLFLARNGRHGQKPHRQSGDQKERGEGGFEAKGGEISGYAEFHRAAPGPRMTSPAPRPERISVSPPTCDAPVWTTTSFAVPSRFSTRT